MLDQLSGWDWDRRNFPAKSGKEGESMTLPFSDSGKGMDDGGSSMELREELLAEAWQLFIRLTAEQVAQILEQIRGEGTENG